MLTKKGLLITDPRVKELTETQLVFEAESLNLAEENRYEDLSIMAQAAKKAAINLLGLNLLPMRDEESGLLRAREDNEIMPLLPAICREDVAKHLADTAEELVTQEEVQADVEREQREGSDMSVNEFIEFMRSDIDFIEDEEELRKRAAVQSPEYQYAQENMIKTLTSEEKKQFEELFGPQPALEGADGYEEAALEEVEEVDAPIGIEVESVSFDGLAGTRPSQEKSIKIEVDRS